MKEFYKNIKYEQLSNKVIDDLIQKRLQDEELARVRDLRKQQMFSKGFELEKSLDDNVYKINLETSTSKDKENNLSEAKQQGLQKRELSQGEKEKIKQKLYYEVLKKDIPNMILHEISNMNTD